MSTGRFLGGLLIGGALGAIIGMLIAPRRGEETRDMIREEISGRVKDSVSEVKNKANSLKEKAVDKAELLREKSQLLAQELESAGRETLDKLRSGVKTASKAPEESPN